jgi:propanol-preferring alcohol dehydrogenase
MTPDTMQAALMQGFGQPLVLADRPRPKPAADEVLVKVEFCGVCHSDLHIIDGDTPGFKAGTKPELIPGHEAVGTVVARGDDVRHLELGQRVGVAWLHHACGQCEQCREGLENLCRKATVTGMTVDGGYADFMRAKASHAVPIPDGLSSSAAAPLFCAGVTSYRALKNAGVREGQRVAVVGIGGLGHLAVQIARAFGAEVIALDVAPGKLDQARALGAAHAFDAQATETPKAVRTLGGAHVVVVTSAARAAYDLALKCLRPAGTLAVVGLPPQPLSFGALQLVSGEYRIMGSAVGTRDDLAATLELAAAGRLHCDHETRPLDAVNDVLERLRSGQVNGRIVLRCNCH